MKLFDTLYNYTNDELKKFVKLLNGFSKLTRKDQMVVFLLDELLSPDKLRGHWQRLDVNPVMDRARITVEIIARQARHLRAKERPPSARYWQTRVRTSNLKKPAVVVI